MSVESLATAVRVLDKIDVVIGKIAAARTAQARAAAAIEGLLLDHHESDEELHAAISSMQELLPGDLYNLNEDQLQIKLNDKYDELTCALRARIVAIGILSYAESLLVESANRLDAREVRKHLQESLGSDFNFDAPGIDGAI